MRRCPSLLRRVCFANYDIDFSNGSSTQERHAAFLLFGALALVSLVVFWLKVAEDRQVIRMDSKVTHLTVPELSSGTFSARRRLRARAPLFSKRELIK
jgi:hypothetical protein